MFFKTQLKSIGTGGAVDMQGRRLAFIGYLPCKAGDWGSADYAYTPIHKLAREQTNLKSGEIREGRRKSRFVLCRRNYDTVV